MSDPRAQPPDTTPALLARAAAHAPDATALVAGDLRLSYAQYAAAVAALAAELAAAQAGRRPVALLLRNGIEIAVALFAAQSAGAIAAPLNPDYTAPELAPMLALARPAAVVAHADLAEKLRSALPPGWTGALILLPPDPAAWTRALIATQAPPPPAADRQAHAVLQFTGGTTGRPKGVLLTHRAVATNVAQREAVLPTRWADERVICMMPLFHSFGIAMGLHLAANCAGSLHILPRYRPDWTLDTIEREGITRLPAGPTVFASLLGYDGLARARVASLRSAYSGSAPLAAETLARWEALTGVPVYEGYGQSEAGPVLTYHGPGMALKQGSVGPPVPGTRIEVVDVETGTHVLPPGTPGEIRARGPQLMSGYLDDPEATSAALRDGWLYTGDIGRLDADFYLTIVDRKKDMAIVSGFNVYPREVDEALMAHPAVAEAAAVAIPDSYRGEALWAFIAARVPIDPAALHAHCEARLVRYKRPTAIEVMDQLPRTPVGKIDKTALKALASERARHVA